MVANYFCRGVVSFRLLRRAPVHVVQGQALAGATARVWLHPQGKKSEVLAWWDRQRGWYRGNGWTQMDCGHIRRLLLMKYENMIGLKWLGRTHCNFVKVLCCKVKTGLCQ